MRDKDSQLIFEAWQDHMPDPKERDGWGQSQERRDKAELLSRSKGFERKDPEKVIAAAIQRIRSINSSHFYKPPSGRVLKSKSQDRELKKLKFAGEPIDSHPEIDAIEDLYYQFLDNNEILVGRPDIHKPRMAQYIKQQVTEKIDISELKKLQDAAVNAGYSNEDVADLVKEMQIDNFLSNPAAASAMDFARRQLGQSGQSGNLSSDDDQTSSYSF